MTHVGILEYLNGRSVDWMEKVGDAQYGASVRARRRQRLTRVAPRVTAHNPRAHSS
jgi:4-carboxymuconolactone decarboxylase